MAVKPTPVLQWANDDIEETKTINGSAETLPNKVEPTQEFADSGLLYKEPLPRPYLNYFLNLTAQYVSYLVTRGDEHEASLVRDSINNATAKTTLVDADIFGVLDSAASNALKKVTFANLKNSIGASTESNVGLIELATQAETLAGTDIERAVTPATLKAALDNLLANHLPSGTTTVFYQTNAPVGWTKSTAVDDMTLLITSGVDGGSTGGTWQISGIGVGAHALTVAELPAHHHFTGPYIQADETFPYGSQSAGNGSGLSGGGSGARREAETSDTGSGNPHNHQATHDGNWRPAHAKFILCVKD